MKTQLPEKIGEESNWNSTVVVSTIDQLIAYLEEAEAAYEETLNGYSKHHRKTQPENTIPTDAIKKIQEDDLSSYLTHNPDGFYYQIPHDTMRLIIKNILTAGAASRNTELREMITGSYQEEIVELMRSNNQQLTKVYIQRGLEVWKEQLLMKLSTPPTTEKTSNLESV